MLHPSFNHFINLSNLKKYIYIISIKTYIFKIFLRNIRTYKVRNEVARDVQSQHRELRFISDTSADLCFYPRSIALGPRNCIIAAHQRYNLRGFMHA